MIRTLFGGVIAARQNVKSPTAMTAFATGVTPESVIVHPSGKFAYVANGNGQGVSVFAVDPTSGELTVQGEVAVQQIPTFLGVRSV